MTEYTPFFIIIIIIILSVNLFLIVNKGGLKNNIFTLFILATFIFYLILTPAVYYYTESWYAVNKNIKDYWGIGFLQILLHTLFYTFGYFLTLNKHTRPLKLTSVSNRINFFKGYDEVVFIIFILLFSLIFINTLSVGINFIDILVGKHSEPTLGLPGGTYYIQNFADSLITIIILSYYFKLKKTYYYIIFTISMILFLILGFRYRILLTFFGLFIIFLFDNGLSLKSVIKYLIITK
jgi:hypothetical protein